MPRPIPTQTPEMIQNLIVIVVSVQPTRASEPVSPMKVLAGGAFHHRETDAGTENRSGDYRELERIADHVTTLREYQIHAG
jgi:hypothetical protein